MQVNVSWWIRGLKHTRNIYNNQSITSMESSRRVQWGTISQNVYYCQGQCLFHSVLCDYCENCELMTKALVAAGVKGIPSSKYLCIDATLCDVTVTQFGTDYKFRKHDCITRRCSECGKCKLKIILEALNVNLLRLNNPVTWHK